MMQTSYNKVRPKNDTRRQRRNLLPLEFNDIESIYHPSDDTVFELHTKKEEPYIEKELQPSDTLQSLALDFNCSIAELKRVNKIHKENEIFALRVVKIPIIPGSFIIEKLQSGTTKQSGHHKLIVTDSEQLSLSENTAATTADSTNDSISLVPSDENQKFSVLTPFNNQSANCTLNDHLHLTENINNFQLNTPTVSVEDSSFLWRCNGDDCGISWKLLLICIISLGLTRNEGMQHDICH